MWGHLQEETETCYRGGPQVLTVVTIPATNNTKDQETEDVPITRKDLSRTTGTLTYPLNFQPQIQAVYKECMDKDGTENNGMFNGPITGPV